MSRQPRLNIKLIGAGICILAGLIILWRTFGSAPQQVAEIPTSVATLEPTRRANAELSTPMPSLTASSTSNVVEVLPTTAVPTSSPLPTATLAPPTAIIPTAAVVLPTNAQPTLQPTVTSQVVVPPTQLIPSPTILRPTNPPSLLPSPTAQIVATTAVAATALPTTSIVASATSAVQPTATFTATSTSTLAPTATLSPTVSPTPGSVTVTYRVEGVAQRVYISYFNERGENKDVEVSTPWTLTITTAWDADLAVDAYTDVDINVPISCSILINGNSVTYDQDMSYPEGVTCERFLN
jgi:Mycobacterium membrane protein